MSHNFFILIGPAASGKSTWAKSAVKSGMADYIISSDAMRGAILGSEEDQSQNGIVFNLCEKAISLLLNKEKSIIFDATNLAAKTRRVYINLTKKLAVESGLDIRIYAVLFTLPKEECIINNRLRNRTVPDWIIEKHISQLQTPELSEGFDEIIIV